MRIIYEPKGEKPALEELYSTEKSAELIKGIESADLPEDIKDFLRAAAFRHIRFNYKKIADYYAHADKDLQELIEDSGMVIIDFEKAVQLGYVKLSKEVAKQFGITYGEEY